MRLREIDKENIYISNLKGHNKKDKPIYGKVKMIKGQVNDISGRVYYNENGVQEKYNYKLLIEQSEDTIGISKDTRFWIRTTPSTREDDYNCKVSKNSNFQNGIMTLYLKVVEQNWETIYTYSEDYDIYSIQCLFDKDNLVLKIPKSLEFEIAYDTLIWFKEPSSVEDTSCKLVLKEKLEDSNNYYQYKMELYA